MFKINDYSKWILAGILLRYNLVKKDKYYVLRVDKDEIPIQNHSIDFLFRKNFITLNNNEIILTASGFNIAHTVLLSKDIDITKGQNVI